MSALLPSLYFNNPMGRIFAHPDGYVLLRYDASYRTLADVEDILIHVGRLLQQRGWNRLLSDQRHLTPFTETEQALILNYWQARHFTMGPTISAVIVSPNVFTRLSSQQIQEQAHGALHYRFFEHEAEAAAWLTH